jgi:hypothetical protein
MLGPVKSTTAERLIPLVVEYLQFRMGSAHNSAAWFARWETRINGTEDLQEFGQGARAR